MKPQERCVANFTSLMTNQQKYRIPGRNDALPTVCGKLIGGRRMAALAAATAAAAGWATLLLLRVGIGACGVATSDHS